MEVILTKKQAIDLGLDDNNLEFVRAAFYTGHSMFFIKEHIHADAYDRERTDIIQLAKDLGMSDADTVGVVDVL